MDRSVTSAIVMKFGGSSLSPPDRARRAAELVAAAHRAGQPTVVVVSAHGNTTDKLLELAGEVGSGCSARETDQLLATGECASAALLAMELIRLGVPAVSLTGLQAGILATGKHGDGNIVTIETGRVTRLLGEGSVAVVAGFQGVSSAGDVITLGRGGSDTTAVALAAKLLARRCQIYTDVDGVHTADPRIVSSARVLPVVDCETMAEMAFAGAKVLHSRAVELAAMHGVKLEVAGLCPGHPGTVIPGGARPTWWKLGAPLSPSLTISTWHA